MLEVSRPEQSPLVLQGFSVIDEQKLQQLDDASLLDLARSGLLAWVHAHLMSLRNVSLLADRLAAPGNGSREAVDAGADSSEGSAGSEGGRSRSRSKGR